MKKKILSLTLAGFLATTLWHTLYAETTVSGAIDAEAVFNDDGDNTEISTELGFEHKVSKKIDVYVLFKYEKDDGLIVDDAVINYQPDDTTDITFGRQDVPFGRYDSNMITDPVTLDLGETEEEALLITKRLGAVSASAYIFKDKADGANNNIDNFGVDVAYENEKFSVGAGYLSDVVDTTVAGVNVHAKVTFGRASIIAEYNKLDDLANVNPNASHIEFAYDLGGEKIIAATYQETSEAEGLELPKEVYGFTYNMPIYKNTSIEVEYLNATAYDDVEDDAITLKLSYEF